MERFTLLILFFNCFLNLSHGLTYKDILLAKSGTLFSPQEIKLLNEKDFLKSLEILGAQQLLHEQAEVIWQRLLKIYDEVSEIPEDILRSLGWVIASIPLNDLTNITLFDIDTVTAFGEYHKLSLSQLQVIANQVLLSWNKDPEEYSYIDLIALNQILCGFNISIIMRIHPQSYKEAAINLRNIKDCPFEILQALANLAVNPEAFGPPNYWTTNEVSTIGCILAGMDSESIASISGEAMKSLTIDIIHCLPTQTFQAFTTGQLSKLLPSLASKILEEKRNVLSEKFKQVLSETSKHKFYNNSITNVFHFPFYISLITFIF